ncbi:hypothetical protein B0T17DRAFT_306311 [Bombardia bombarda]|uniref:NmrA-like domain-containing protein n=1 Tax=Bombardia bombarda TaxID=252184 RepID=A0AA39WUJ8_9PEZI|nr:hypothetical protein B0T17DRAFT_306311 [Bombardia bombarda]
MVKIAVAGGSGQLAREIIDELVAQNKHEILVLSRGDPVPERTIKGTTWVKVDYSVDGLTQALKGVHTVFSFVLVHKDPDNAAQKALVDAAIAAGVKRFAPSEWGAQHVEGLDWYGGKAVIRDYLKEKNKDKKVIEYTLFRCGNLMQYLASPYKTSAHIQPMSMAIDIHNRRALIVGDAPSLSTWTTIQDVAKIVAKAVDYEGEWPAEGGVRGTNISSRDLIALAEKIRGGRPFAVETFKVADLKAEIFEPSWMPVIEHPSIPAEELASMVSYFLRHLLVATTTGAMVVVDGWNRVFPEYKFTQVEEFLEEVWRGKE